MTNISPQYRAGFRAAIGGGNGIAAPPIAAETTMVCADSTPQAVQSEAAAMLSKEESIKRELFPLDAFPRLIDCAKNNRPPDAGDQYRFRWFGLFYQGPRQDAFVLRLRLPGGRLRAHQLAGLAAITQELASGHVVCNAQGGLDIPGVAVRDAVEAMCRVEEIGLRSLRTGGDCVWAVRGGEYEYFPDASRTPVIYLLVRELEQAVAMDRRLADLPAGCEVILRGFDEAPVECDTGIPRVIFQAIRAPAEGGTLPDSNGCRFQLTVPEFGSLDASLSAAQVVPACLELIGQWAVHGNRANCGGMGIAGFCARVGAEQLGEWLTRRVGPLAVIPADTQSGVVAASPMPGGLPIPAEGLLSATLQRLGELAVHYEPGDVRLASARLFLPGVSDRHAAEDALRRALNHA